MQFNTVCRVSVLEAARDTALAYYAEWAYGTLSVLRFRDYKINSRSGVQQGDPASPVLFAMSIVLHCKPLATAFLMA